MASLKVLLPALLVALPLVIIANKGPKYMEAMYKDELEFRYAGKDADRTPAFAVLHVYITCKTTYVEAKKVAMMLIREQFWPNVYWKNGQDARPTLYIFNAEKKILNRTEVHEKTAEEIKAALNSHGFYPRPEPEEEEEEEGKAGKSEL